MIFTLERLRAPVRLFVVVAAGNLSAIALLRAEETRESLPLQDAPRGTSEPGVDTPAAGSTTDASVAAGQDADDASAPETAPAPRFFAALLDAFVGGDLTFDLRARAEIVEQDGTDTAQAYTERIRLGYGTRPFHGFSFYLDVEDIRSADDDLYNAAGLNGAADKAVVADPEDTELNQLLARYDSEYFGATAGRQRLVLDDHRFVGNVGWRQNEQTFDAYVLTSNWPPATSLLYGYVDDVNRIFGPDADRDFESDSHLVRLSYSGLPLGELTGFAYLLDFPNSNDNSSDSLGLRLTGSQDLSQKCSVTYAASYAHQVDAGDNPTDYEADYYFLEVAVARKGLGKVGLGYEVLGSDSGNFAFRTPLATLHKFNGWADLFLTTPNDGLEDLYFLAGADLPLGIKSLAVYHLFFSEHRSRDLGGEFDALLAKKLNDHVTLLGKLAIFHSESEVPATQKFWLQLEIEF